MTANVVGGEILHPGVKIEVSDIGEVLVATRDFHAGEVVISETPIVLWSMNELELVRKFMDLSEEVRNNMLNTMFFLQPDNTMSDQKLHDSTCKISLERCWKAAEIININYYAGSEKVSTNVIFNVLSIANFNCHRWVGPNTMALYETEANKANKSQMKALLPFLSKVEHSCIPNVIYSSQNQGHVGNGVYIATEDIIAGDNIAFGYTDLNVPCAERRKKLLATKDFYCMCKRCSQPCLLSAFLCLQPNCKGCIVANSLTLEDVLSGKNTITWTCLLCNSTDPPVQQINALQQIEEGFLQLQQRFNVNHDGGECLQQLEVMLEECRHVLGPSHYFFTKILEEISTLCLSLAEIMRNHVKASMALRFQSVDTLVEAAQRIECEHANCLKFHKGEGCPVKHKATPSSAQRCFWAGLELCKLIQYDIFVELCNPRRHKDLLEFILRYIPAMKCQWGENDADVMKIETTFHNTLIKKPNREATEKCSTSFASSFGSTMIDPDLIAILKKLESDSLKPSPTDEEISLKAAQELLDLLDIEEKTSTKKAGKNQGHKKGKKR